MKIQPLKVNIFDDYEVDTLRVEITSDNLRDTCNLHFCLYRTEDENTSNVSINNYSNTLTITGEDYLEWDGNNNFPYQYVTAKLGLIPVIEEAKGKTK